MLSDEEWLQLCQHLGLSEQAQVVIARIRSSPPSRRCRSAAGISVHASVTPAQDGVTIRPRGHRNELAGIYEKGTIPRPGILRPAPTIKLVYQPRVDGQVGVLHTPDFFANRTDSAGLGRVEDRKRS